MEAEYIENSVKKRLILAGITELEESGVDNFSLRRVAVRAQVSCAAPYRHFKDKDELISAVIEFVVDGWTLLSRQIGEIFSSDSKSLVVELAVAGLRFWIANGNFRTVIMVSSTLPSGERGPLQNFDRPIIDAVSCYAAEKGIDTPDLITFKLLSMIYGAVILVDGGYESAEKAADNLRSVLLSEL